MKRKLLACALSISLITPTFAAIEIDETSYGPSYGSTLTDVAIGKPLQLAGAILGTAAYIAAIPFSLASDSLDERTEYWLKSLGMPYNVVMVAPFLMITISN